MLFTVSELEQPNHTIQSASISGRDYFDHFVRAGVRDKIEEVFPLLEQKIYIDFVSKGDWSTHELVFWILSQTGPADLYIATWSMTENAARMLIDAKQKGVIRKIFCLFDYRIKVRYPDVNDFVKQHFERTGIDNSHAKVTVIVNDKWAVRILGSSNFTNNPRIEVGTLVVDQQKAELHINWILAVLNNQDYFDESGNTQRN
ncbi:hypothetical protein [Runella zeae]|uniref:hypothetical protein n=1 Tax=Runella zeae TaxID=94255 RepID=UPI0003FF37E9|nr:hypothetical protein [Runella zeae]